MKSSKKCCMCKIVKSLLGFYRSSREKDGHQTLCKECDKKRPGRKDYKIRRYAAYKDWYRNGNLRRKYGINIEQFNMMLMAQGGRCKICMATDPGGRKGSSFRVDHCHSTGKVRGLLCDTCNFMLGHARNSPDVLRSGAKYLENA